MGQILCLAAQSAPLGEHRSGKGVFPKVAEAEKSSKERLTEGGGDSRPMSGVFSQRGFWKFAFWLLGKEDTHGNGARAMLLWGRSLMGTQDRASSPPELLYQVSLLQSFSYRPGGSPLSDKGNKTIIIFLRLSTIFTSLLRRAHNESHQVI